MLEKEMTLRECDSNNHKDHPHVERKICTLLNCKKNTGKDFSLEDNVKNIIFLRNQFIHYNYLGIPGDTFPSPKEEEKQLNACLQFFNRLVSDGEIPGSPVFSNDDLLPFGLFSSAFSKWALESVIHFIESLSENESRILKLNFTL